ncbi:HAD family hydrolase [Halobacillus naozhouensis]|uniref:HAD family hydrolase n=1 Tax=Halobacillus naozhouensis TaxID=554880 RepID=A0ABY8J3W3_9BACI|nr:HAD family hydrolase [Halobacillus naozhouensis]WFT75641.1 HAD family hydrolase [Halobacillus naozhouensis]
MLKAIIFDFDGLIFDTETPQYQVLQELFRENESELPLEVWQDVIGTDSDFCPYTYLQTKTNKQYNIENLKKEIDNRFRERVKTMACRPGVKDYLSEAKEMGFRIGLASSSHYKWVSTHLKNLGIFDEFECMKTADDVKNVKPDPALYLKAAEAFKVEAEECLVFEDSANGALAAKRAGMACVIVPNEVTSGLSFCKVERRLSSMEEIKLKQLVEEIQI